MATSVSLPGGLAAQLPYTRNSSLGVWVGLTPEGGHTVAQLAALADALAAGGRVVKVDGVDYHPAPEDWFVRRDTSGQVVAVWLWVPSRGRKVKR